MSVKSECAFCYNWKAVKWNMAATCWDDAVARCSVKGRFITAHERCDAFCTGLEGIKVNRLAPAIGVSTYSAALTGAKKEKKEETLNVGPGLIKELFEHQKKAVERYDKEKFSVLFFEAGCGKTATTLRLMKNKYERKEIDLVIIIAPNKVHTQWYKEQIPEWLKDMVYASQIFGGHKGQKKINPYKEGVMNLLCTNTDTFSTPEKWKEIIRFCKGHKVWVVLDEATSIKNIKAKRTQRIMQQFKPATGRSILTGTPITNSVMDAWSMMEFCIPGFWGRNFYSFRAHFGMFYKLWTDQAGEISVPLTEEVWLGIKRCMSYDEAYQLFSITEDTFRVVHSQTQFSGPYKNVEELKAKLDTVASFVKLTDIMDMPEQTYIRRITPTGEDQQRVYTQLENEMLASYGEGECNVANKMVLYLRLQQVSSGFIPIIVRREDEDDYFSQEVRWFPDVPKLDQLYEDVRGVAEPRIVITRFSCEAERIFDDLKKEGYKVSLQTGWKTEGSIEDFQQNKYDVMVANIKVISKGFNLQNSHTMFYYSNTFSLEDRLQSEGRIFRIGQKNECRYFDYVAEDTIDMKVVAALRQRRELMDYIRGVGVKSFLCDWDKVFDEEYGEVYK